MARHGRNRRDRAEGNEDDEQENNGDGAQRRAFKEMRDLRTHMVSFTVNVPDEYQDLDLDSFPFELVPYRWERDANLVRAQQRLPEEERDANKTYQRVMAIKSAAWQWERGADNNRLHIQGCIQIYLPRRRFTTYRDFFALLPDGFYPHFDRIKSDWGRVWKYCTKDEDGGEWGPGGGRVPLKYIEWDEDGNVKEASVSRPVTYGELPTGEEPSDSTRGKRTDLEAVYQLVTSGAYTKSEALLRDMETSVTIGQNMRYASAMFEAYAARNNTEHRINSVYFFWGKTGTGKSRLARKMAKDAGMDLYELNISEGNGFWNGYNGQEAVIIDDVSSEELERSPYRLTTFLRWFDRYASKVNTKGGWEPLRATLWFVTSNQPPEQWWPKAGAEHMAALSRRVTRVQHFAEMYTPPEGWGDG